MSAQTTELRLVSTAWSPFTNEPGQPRFALDLVEAGLGRVGIKTRTTIVDAAQFTRLSSAAKFDGSAAAWKDAARERTLLFSQPYLENRLVLVARRGGDVSAATLADLKGKRIAIVEGYRTVRPSSCRGRRSYDRAPRKTASSNCSTAPWITR